MTAIRLGISAMLSLGIHGSLLAGLGVILTAEPDPGADTPRPIEARISTLSLSRTEASSVKSKSDAASKADAKSSDANSSDIPMSTALALQSQADALREGSPLAFDLSSSTFNQNRVAARDAVGEMLFAIEEKSALRIRTSNRTNSIHALPVPLSATTLAKSETPDSVSVIGELPASTELILDTTPQQESGLEELASNGALLVASVPDQSAGAEEKPLRAQLASTRRPAPSPAPVERPTEFVATEGPLVALPSRVHLAWSGGLASALSTATIDAAAALSVPGASRDGHALRDQIAAQLAEIECARTQTVFDPVSGNLDLHGHVPTDADRDALITALAKEIGGTLPVADKLRRLDEPQCGILVSLSGMPLPQSVEQFTNPRVIGENLQVRTYEYNAGQSMRFDLAGADYDGFLYVDYYDAEGRVIHLVPNDVTGSVELLANTAITLGGGGPSDIAEGRLELRASAPFGQDIVVAMVANRPLFDVRRITVEDARGYLADLEHSIRDLRGDSEFRGEWLYLFIQTNSG